MGTGVMIGAGIFALTGQIAELAGTWFPLAFLVAAVVAGFSAYSYVKMAQQYPSAGGIAMFLKKAYGRGLMTGACALLMYFSMVINESLVARTFGTYVLQAFNAEGVDWLIPALGVGLLVFAFLINILSNRFIQTFSFEMLTSMQLVPHRHFKLPGNLQSLGAVFYIVMDICIHWGVFKHLRREVDAKAWILITAIILDVVVLAAFLSVKAQSDVLVVWVSLIGLVLVFVAEKWFLKLHEYDEEDPHYK
jgi:amino acid transporter